MVPVNGILTICGGVLIHLTLGTIYTFGNLSPYITSYLRTSTSQTHLQYSDSMWIFAVTIIGQGLFMMVGGIFDKILPPRWSSLIGGLTMSFGVTMTYFTIQKSFVATIFTYGLIFGFGIGIAYSIPMSCAMKWFPSHKGLINGIIVAGFGAGAVIFDQVQTIYINQDNVKPNITVEPNNEKYFGQTTLLQRVPYVFILLGCIYAGMVLIGSSLLTLPKLDESSLEDSSLIQHSDETDDEHEEYEKLSISSSDIDTTCLEDKHPISVIQTRAFWTLWFNFLVNGHAVVIVSTLYKAYGQTFISNDYLLAAVGSCAALFNGFARILWGYLADRFSFRFAMMIQCCLMAFLLFTFVLTEKAGSWLYFIWVCLLFGTFAGSYALFPTAIAKTFGEKYFAINYGLLFISQAIAGVTGTILAQHLSDQIGWVGLFILVGCFALLGFVLAFSFNVRKPNGEHI